MRRDEDGDPENRIVENTDGVAWSFSPDVLQKGNREARAQN